MASHENKEYFDKISVSVVYSVCPSCHYCIGFDSISGFQFSANVLAVLRFGTILSAVLRLLTHPNTPLFL